MIYNIIPGHSVEKCRRDWEVLDALEASPPPSASPEAPSEWRHQRRQTVVRASYSQASVQRVFSYHRSRVYIVNNYVLQTTTFALYKVMYQQYWGVVGKTTVIYVRFFRDVASQKLLKSANVSRSY